MHPTSLKPDVLNSNGAIQHSRNMVHAAENAQALFQWNLLLTEGSFTVLQDSAPFPFRKPNPSLQMHCVISWLTVLSKRWGQSKASATPGFLGDTDPARRKLPAAPGAGEEPAAGQVLWLCGSLHTHFVQDINTVKKNSKMNKNDLPMAIR